MRSKCYWSKAGVGKCRWCNGYRHPKIKSCWAEFKPRTRLFSFHMALITLVNVWIHLLFPHSKYGEIVRGTRLSDLGRATGLGKEQSLSKPSMYKLNSLHSKHVVFLIDAQLILNPVGNLTLYTAVRMVGRLWFETVPRHRFIHRTSSLIFKKCWDSYRPGKRVFPQSISRCNLW